MIGVAVLAGTAFVTDYVINNMETTASSYYDKIEDEKKKAGELLKIIDVFDTPLRVDLINIGLDEIIIKKIFVDGKIDETYTINGIQNNVIPLHKVTTILPTDSTGQKVKIITSNNKEFELGN